MSEAVPRRTRSQLTPITDPQTASARLRRSGFCIRALCEFPPHFIENKEPNDTCTDPDEHRFHLSGTSEPLLDGIDVTFARGWTAVLGDNGIGKTTLAKLAIGRLSPDAGRISPTPNRLHTGYCPQNTDETPENLEDFACDWSPQAMEIRRELGIGDDWPWRPGTLSGGEAKRLQIACALATDPDVLVLDEPRRGKEFFRTFDLPAYLRKHFNMFGGTEYRVTLRCAADLEPVMRERFGREPVFCPEEDGHFHFDVPICVSQQFFGWVCWLWRQGRGHRPRRRPRPAARDGAEPCGTA